MGSDTDNLGGVSEAEDVAGPGAGSRKVFRKFGRPRLMRSVL